MFLSNGNEMLSGGSLYECIRIAYVWKTRPKHFPHPFHRISWIIPLEAIYNFEFYFAKRIPQYPLIPYLFLKNHKIVKTNPLSYIGRIADDGW